MILTISFKNKKISINGTAIEYKMNALSSFRSGLLFSYYTNENDEGTWRVSGEGVCDLDPRAEWTGEALSEPVNIIS